MSQRLARMKRGGKCFIGVRCDGQTVFLNEVARRPSRDSHEFSVTALRGPRWSNHERGQPLRPAHRPRPREGLGGSGAARRRVGGCHAAMTPSTEAEAATRVLVEEILAAEAQEERLLSHMSRLAADKRDDAVCWLFESLFWRLRITNYWILFRAAEAYEIRGKPELAFLLFGFAQALHPESSGSPAASRALFMSFAQRGRPNDMLDVFETHAAHSPQKPIAALYEIRPLLNKTGRSAEPYLGPPGNPRVDAARTDRMVFPASTRAACTIEFLGGPPIPALLRLAVNASRPAVTVACLQ